MPTCTPRSEWGEGRVLRVPPEDLSPPHQARHQLSHWALHNSQERVSSGHKSSQHPYHEINKRKISKSTKNHHKQSENEIPHISGPNAIWKNKQLQDNPFNKKMSLHIGGYENHLESKTQNIRARWIKSPKETREKDKII